MHVTAISLDDVAALAHPSAYQPDALVLDLRDEAKLPDPLALLRRTHPATGILVVTSRLDPVFMLEAMRSGVNECVTDPVTQESLQEALARVLAMRLAPVTGEVLAFLGAKGGVGATTIAVNVATSLARVAPGQTLLIDLHPQYGDASVFLGAETRFSAADAMESIQRLDDALFKNLLVRTKGGVDLLASSDRVSAPMEAVRVRALIEFAARHYKHVVLDCPRSVPAVLEALEVTSSIVVVTNQELATTRSAGRIAGALRQRYGKDRVKVVLSRYDSNAEIGTADVERVVGVTVKHLLPSNYRQSLEALNKGRPLVLDNHNKLASSLESLARELGGLKQEKAAKAERETSLFGRLTGRK
jgi:pilus assembly protein CpaE